MIYRLLIHNVATLMKLNCWKYLKNNTFVILKYYWFTFHWNDEYSMSSVFSNPNFSSFRGFWPNFRMKVVSGKRSIFFSYRVIVTGIHTLLLQKPKPCLDIHVNQNYLTDCRSSHKTKHWNYWYVTSFAHYPLSWSTYSRFCYHLYLHLLLYL